jgi:TonB family protein
MAAMSAKPVLVAAVLYVAVGTPIAYAQSVGGVQAVQAAQSDDPLTYYRAYEVAFAAGDVVAASGAARSAWQTAERVWDADNPNIAGLAFNAAWSMALNGKVAEARDPARRAVALATRFPDKVNVKEAQFLDAYANLIAAPNAASLAAFQPAALAVGNGGWGDYLLPKSYIDAARIALNVNNARLARQFIDVGLTEQERLAPNNTNLRMGFFILRTQASLVLENYAQAVNEAMEARRAYGPQKSERDVNWATLSAWESAARAVYESVYDVETRIGSRVIQQTDRAGKWDDEELMQLNRPPFTCTNARITRRGSGPTGINFPTRESYDGLAGGAFVRARLDPEGRVISTDILASLPRPAYGTAAVEGIRTWRYNVPADTPEACRYVDVELSYSFPK